MAWDIDKEKLLCHMVLDDSVAQVLSDDATEAFWRGFIVQNRATGQIMMKARWNYKSKGRSWVEVKPGPDVKDPLLHLRRMWENVLCSAMEKLGVPTNIAARAIECFYPPDDGGDGMKTVNWLKERELIGEARFEAEG